MVPRNLGVAPEVSIMSMPLSFLSARKMRWFAWSASIPSKYPVASTGMAVSRTVEAQLVQAPSSMTPAAAPHTAAATDATEAAHETGLAHDRMTPKKRASRPKYEPGSPALPSSASCSRLHELAELCPDQAPYEQRYEPAPPDRKSVV